MTRPYRDPSPTPPERVSFWRREVSPATKIVVRVFSIWVVAVLVSLAASLVFDVPLLSESELGGMLLGWLFVGLYDLGKVGCNVSSA